MNTNVSQKNPGRVEGICLQMYSFMDGNHNDTRENLKAASQMGYDGVELFGMNLEVPAEEMKQLLDTYGLTPVSMHVNADQILTYLPYAKTLGMHFIGIGMHPMMNEEEVHAFAAKLNELGEACGKEGLMVTYHNHTQEFGSYGEKRIIDILMEETNPEQVGFELDAGWCAAAGVDPIAFVKEKRGRIRLIHIKESSEAIGPQPFVDYESLEKDENGRPVFTPEMIAEMDRQKKINCGAGEGLVDWKALKEAADAQGCAAYIVEREYSYQGTRLECLQADIDQYRKQLAD